MMINGPKRYPKLSPYKCHLNLSSGNRSLNWVPCALAIKITLLRIPLPIPDTTIAKKASVKKSESFEIDDAK